MENQATTAQPQKKILVSRKAWIVISIISLLIALSNASKSGANGPLEFLPVLFRRIHRRTVTARWRVGADYRSFPLDFPQKSNAQFAYPDTALIICDSINL